MPIGCISIDIDTDPDLVFDLIHDYRRRLEWDPFLREASLIGEAESAAVGVTSRCTARRTVGGLTMETEYVTFNRPVVAAVKMIRGPFFLKSFAASIRHVALRSGLSRVTYRYNFVASPLWIAPVIEPIVQKVFYRETTGRLIALKRFMELQVAQVTD